MRYTLLELVQRILGAMESDEVSSVTETQEAQDVAHIVKECYFDIVSNLHPAEEEGLFKLDASTDDTLPCLMYVPTTVSKIDWLKYNIGDATPNWRILRFLDVDEFLHYQSGQDEGDTTLESMTVEIDGKSYEFRYKNDAYPTYYTVLKDRYIIFDAYDSSEENTLTEVRSLGFGQLVPAWEMTDNFVPDLDPRHFQLLLQEAKAVAFTELKQIENPKAERRARRNWVMAQKTRDDNDPDSRQKRYQYGRRC